MLRQILSIVITTLISTLFFGQQEEAEDFYGLEILGKAENAFCQGDTSTVMKWLEQFSKTHPDLGTVLIVNKRLANFYLELHQTQKAITALQSTIRTDAKKGYLIPNDSCGLFSEVDYSAVKAEACVKMSTIFSYGGDYDSALYYLKLADTDLLPHYGGCANGMIMYKTKLSLDFANLYLQMGDTSSAINRLIDFFLSNEWHDQVVTEKLKSVLIQKYSQEEITEAFISGINQMSIQKDPIRLQDYVTFTVFGRAIQKYAFEDLQYYKNYFLNHPNIKLLIE